MRRTAQALAYPDQSGNFPGRNSRERVDTTTIDRAVEQLLGEPLSPITSLRAAAGAAINGIIASDTNRSEAWEPTMSVPARYNRLLLLRPWLFHTAGPGFGSDFDTGRLVAPLLYASATGPASS